MNQEVGLSAWAGPVDCRGSKPWGIEMNKESGTTGWGLKSAAVHKRFARRKYLPFVGQLRQKKSSSNLFLDWIAIIPIEILLDWYRHHQWKFNLQSGGP
jgi:hypothetical protein